MGVVELEFVHPDLFDNDAVGFQFHEGLRDVGNLGNENNSICALSGSRRSSLYESRSLRYTSEMI